MHKRKVEDVRQWLIEAYEGGPSGILKKYRVSLQLVGIIISSQRTQGSAFSS